MIGSLGGKKSWCVAELNEEYIRCMEDVLALYEKPLLESEPVVCVDEKPIVLHADLRPAFPMRPGRIARRDCEYKRCGTANAFCGVEPKAGRHFTPVTPDRSSPEFADYLLAIAGSAREMELAMEPIHGPLHAETRQLAKSGRDRDQPVLSAVSGPTKNPLARRLAA